MLAPAFFKDINNYMTMRISYAQYRAGSTWYRVPATSVEATVMDDGTVRVKVNVNSDTPLTVNRLELYNTAGELWRYQDCDIEIGIGQSGILFWLDFLVKEVVKEV